MEARHPSDRGPLLVPRLRRLAFASILIALFAGALDDTRVYDRALTPSEIQFLVAEPVPASPAPPIPLFLLLLAVGAWRLRVTAYGR